MENISNPSTVPSSPDMPEEKLKGTELSAACKDLYDKLRYMLDNSGVMQKALVDDPPDPDWPTKDKKTHFTLGEGDRTVIYRFYDRSLTDDTGTETGREFYLMRNDSATKERVLIVRTGQEPGVEFRDLYESEFPVFHNEPDGTKTIGRRVLTKKQVFSQKGAVAKAIRESSRERVDRRYYEDTQTALLGAKRVFATAVGELAPFRYY